MIKTVLSSLLFWIAAAVLVVTLSIVADFGAESWGWFQRSGSFVVLCGAFLSYRSIVRLGRRGVGGANTTVLMGKIRSVDDSGPVQTATVDFDEETADYLVQAAIDKMAGYVGAVFLVIGTFIWGYGDLLGRMLS